MCGLFGSITGAKNSKLSSNQRLAKKRILSGLGLAMEERGIHSTGLACVTPSGLLIEKKAIRAADFLLTKEFHEVINKNPKIIIGHTRHKTVGEIVDDNAHPFQDGQIVGAHNGSVTNWRAINDKVDVDSQVIFELLSKNKNDYEASFKELYGTMAITWVDLREKNTVHLVRHDRPLFITYIPEVDTYFWCSLEIPLRSVITTAIGMVPDAIREVKEDRVITIDGKLGVKVKHVSFKSWKQPASTGYPYSDHYTNRQKTVYQSKPKKSNVGKSFWTIDKGDVKDFTAYSALLDGCGQCGINFKESETFHYQPATNICVHPDCLPEYSEYLRSKKNIPYPTYQSFNSNKHRQILRDRELNKTDLPSPNKELLPMTFSAAMNFLRC